MAKTRILITVKTYPTLSLKYGELVCTAGVRDDGTWVRLYPVPFSRLKEEEKYKKYDWIECDIVKRGDDHRPESYCPKDRRELISVGHMGTRPDWSARRALLLNTCRVYTQRAEIIARARDNTMSLAVFKPTEIIDFQCKEEKQREWDPKKVKEMQAAASQGDLFEENHWRETFENIPKLPYGFYYRFKDADGRESRLKILDWGIGALYWNCMENSADEQEALGKVREKYFDNFVQKDLHFFLGTTLQFHNFGLNPWVIIGVFPIPHERQIPLF